MRLEDYFDFLGTDDIRIKGHRIGIDDVLSFYLEGFSAEEIGALPELKAGRNSRDDYLLSSQSG